MKLTLIDVQSDTDDAVFDGIALQLVLNENAGNLGITPVNVVGPLDANIADVLPQRLAECQRNSHGDVELTRDLDVSGVEQQGKRQVLASFRLPRVGATATSSRLVVGPYHHVAFAVRFQPVVGRVCFVNMNDIPVHVAKLRKKVVIGNGFWKINAIRPKIKAGRGRMKKFELGQKANWRRLVKEIGCQIVTQFMTLGTRKVPLQNSEE